jgi:hypothetical protein
VLARQGHYATNPNALAGYLAADLTVERIGDLLTRGRPSLLGATTPGQPQQERG